MKTASPTKRYKYQSVYAIILERLPTSRCIWDVDSAKVLDTDGLRIASRFFFFIFCRNEKFDSDDYLFDISKRPRSAKACKKLRMVTDLLWGILLISSIVT